MQQETRHRAPNIQNGIVLTADHLIRRANHVEYRRSQGMESYLNVYNYGLMGVDDNTTNEIFVLLDRQGQLQVRFENFKAITLGGHIIELGHNENPDSNNLGLTVPDLNVSFEYRQKATADYFIVLVIHPYDGIPYGDIDPDVVPLHHPYLAPKYTLHLMPVCEARRNALGKFHIPIGKIEIKDQTVVPDDQYIPPCNSYDAHPALQNFYKKIEIFLGTMEMLSANAIQKLNQKKQDEMGLFVYKLCEQIASFTAVNISSFRHTRLHQPPVTLIDFVSSFIHLVRNTIDFSVTPGKQKFFEYCIEWCGVGQSQFEAVLSSLCEVKYNHLNMMESFCEVLRFTNAFTDFFEKVVSLEYRGRSKDIYILGSEKKASQIGGEQTITSKPASRPSFLG